MTDVSQLSETVGDFESYNMSAKADISHYKSYVRQESMSSDNKKEDDVKDPSCKQNVIENM